MAKSKKCFFRTYCFIGKEILKTSKLKLILLAGSLLLEHLNYLSLMIFAGNFIDFYNKSIYLTKLFEITRFDVVALQVFGPNFCLYFFTGLIFGNFLAKYTIFIQMRFKRYYFLKCLRVIAKISGCLIMHCFKIPILRYFVNSEFNSQISSDSIEYPSNDENSDTITSLCNLTVYFSFVVLILTDLVFGNFPSYSKKTFSYSCSLFKLREFFCILFMTFFLNFLDRRVYFATCLVFTSLLGNSYYKTMPYFNTCLNIFFIQNWLSVAVLSFLLILGEIYQNFFVIEFVFPFLYLSLLFMTIEAVNRRKSKLAKKASAKNPFEIELIIRFSLESGKNFEEIQPFFKKNTKNFFEFNLQYIWESLITLKFSGNRKLSLMKLAKVNMCRYKEELVESNYIQTFKYFLNLEVEFYAFCLFEKIIREYPDAGLDILLINFFYCLNSFKENESEVLENISQLCLAFVDQETSSKRLEEMMETVGEQIKSHQKMFFKSQKKFGLKKEFTFMFNGFCTEIVRQEVNLNIHKTEEIMKLDLSKLNKKISNVESDGAILIVSGNYFDIGTILYANTKACELLNYKSGLGLIGTCFTQLIPPPFDEIHKGVLMKFIMYSNVSELQRSHFCILDKNRYCIEVAMHLKLSFYKGNAFFITRFRKMLPEKNLILTEKNWNICGFSQKVPTFFEEFSGNLLVLLPGLLNYLEEYGENQSFFYKNLKNRLVLKKHTLRIQSYELIVVYVDEVSAYDNFDVYGSLCIDTLVAEEFQDKNKRIKVDLENNNSSFKLSKKIEGWEKNLKVLKFLKVFLKASVLVNLLILTSILIIVIQFSQSSEMSTVIFETGLMRYLSLSCLTSIQSLDMLSHNLPVLHTEDYYRKTLKENSEKLEKFSKKYQKISVPFSFSYKFYFDKSKLEVFYEDKKSSYVKNLALSEGISILVKYSKKLAEIPLKNFTFMNDELTFIYKNIPLSYLKALNGTIFDVMKDFLDSKEEIFKTLLYCELVLIFLPVSLLFTSVLCLVSLEHTNKSLWQKISQVDQESLSIQYKRLKKRLKDLHEISIPSKTFENKIKKSYYRGILWIPVGKILVMFLISLGIYLNSLYGPQSHFKDLITEDLNHINFGGLRRMMTPLSFYWTRAAYLECLSKSIDENSYNFNTFGRSLEKLMTVLSEFQSIQDDLMKRFHHPPLNLYSFDQYHDYMLGSVCMYLKNISGCHSSITGYGVHLGLLGYIQEVKGLIESSNKSDSDRLKLIENYQFYVGQSFVKGLEIFSQEIKKSVDLKLLISKMITLVFFIFFVTYYFTVGKKIPEKIQESLENKAFVAGMFLKS